MYTPNSIRRKMKCDSPMVWYTLPPASIIKYFFPGLNDDTVLSGAWSTGKWRLYIEATSGSNAMKSLCLSIPAYN